MKITCLFIALILTVQCVSAQNKATQQPDTSIRNLDLNEVVIKSSEQKKVTKSVHSQNVYIVFNATQPNVAGQYDSTFFATKFPQVEDKAIALHSVELKLAPFDTSLFDVRLIVFQIVGKDTTYKLVDIDASQIDRKHKLKLTLLDKDIMLQPGEFFLGYGFKSKKITASYPYRMYCTSKGEGAMLTLSGNSFKVLTNTNIPYIFPFKVAYKKMM